MNLAPLNIALHGALRLKPHSSFKFAENSAVTALYGLEVTRAAHEFPIAFSAEPDGYFPAALLGVSPDCNAFVDPQGRWLAGYIPAIWRRGALRLARVEGRDDWVLCVDLDSDQISDSEGQAMFDESGNATAIVGQTTQFLAQLEADRVRTLAACAALDRQGLITPWELKIDRGDGTESRLEGLYKIDSEKLAELSGEALSDLHGHAALMLIYAHQISMHKMPLLGRLAGEREAERQKREMLQHGKLDLDRLFGIVEDDPFTF